MDERRFKYMREDFGELPATLKHLTIHLNFTGEFVEATCCIRMTAAQRLDELHLDANSLDIIVVYWCSGPDDKGELLQYAYAREKNRLDVRLPRTVGEGETFFIRTVTRCFPSDHILEGYLPGRYASWCAAAVHVAVPAMGFPAYRAYHRRLQGEMHDDDDNRGRQRLHPSHQQRQYQPQDEPGRQARHEAGRPHATGDYL